MLRTRLLLSFALLIILFGVLSLWFGIGLINDRVVAQAQDRVQLDLNSARSVYNSRLRDVEVVMSMVAGLREVRRAASGQSWDQPELHTRLEGLRSEFGLDFLSVVDAEGRVVLRTAATIQDGENLKTRPDIRNALSGRRAAGSQLMQAGELEREAAGLGEKALLALEDTPKARPRLKQAEERGLVMIAAVPVQRGPEITGAVYGGILVNRNHDLIDRIAEANYAGSAEGISPRGTATVFLMDTRIATTVLKEDGNRALGTRVSKEVADQVLDNAKPWVDRAFVVSDWYLTAYEPIRDLEKEVIGILYVGILEAPFRALARSVIVRFIVITGSVGLLSLAVAFILSGRLSEPIHRLVLAAQSMKKGTYPKPVSTKRTSSETATLIHSFNQMVEVLQERENRLNETNRSLQAVNQNYMETLGFVSHELNNPINAAMNYAYLLKNQMIGPLEEKQLKAAGVIDTSLERLSGMVRHYLELARIEQGRLEPNPVRIDALEDLVQPVLDGLTPQLEERGIRMENGVGEGVLLWADREFGREIFENLLNNAIKYGRENGCIRLSMEQGDEQTTFTVWNEGPGIPDEKRDALFQKFSRLHTGEEAGAIRGTGLGLFIVKHMLELMGGTIRAESGPGEWASFSFTLPNYKTDKPPVV